MSFGCSRPSTVWWRPQVRTANARVVAAVESADVAEEVASAAMKAAGSAVHDEMEAAAVVKETQAALSKALRSIKSIMPAEDSTAAEEERAAVQCALNPMA